MKKIIFGLLVLPLFVFASEDSVITRAANTQKDKNTSNLRELTNDEISSFFIGFEEQARNELKAEEEKKMEKSRQREAQKKVITTTVFSNNSDSERAVLPHDGPSVTVDGNRANTQVPSHLQDTALAIPPIKDATNELLLYGIVCDKGACQAFSNMGVLKTKSKISNFEKVIEIKKDFLKTNIRTIKL